MFKRIFEKPRYTVAAIGGLVAIQGFIFTVIDAGVFSGSMMSLGVVVVVGGLHVEAQSVLKQVTQSLRAYFESFNESFEQFKEKREQNSGRSRLGSALTRAFEQFKEKREQNTERLDEELELQKRRDARDAKVRDLQERRAKECELQNDGHASANTAEASSVVVSTEPAYASAPSPQAKEEFDPFANSVEAHATTNRPEAIPTFVSATPSPPSFLIMQPERVQCPYCGELIVRTAVKCRYCNEFLDGRTTHFQSEEISMGKKVQTIEQTGKFWKLLQAGGVLGVLGAVTWGMIEQDEKTTVVCILVGVPSFVVYVVGRVGAWWCHG